MADTIKYRFVMRRRTAAEWTSVNEILLEGEYGYEKDTGKVKIGDGVTAWNDLDYFAGSGGAGITISDTPPVGPAPGAEWVDATTGIRYTYYDDGDTQQWVEFGPDTPMYLMPRFPEGSSFPGSPANGDKFYRTDLDLLCVYKSALGKWLTVQEYATNIGTWWDDTFVSVDNTAFARASIRRDYQPFLTRLHCSARVQTTSNSTNFWTIALRGHGNTTTTVQNIFSYDTKTIPAGGYADMSTQLNVLLDVNVYGFFLVALKTSSPGTYTGNHTLYYRLVIP